MRQEIQENLLQAWIEMSVGIRGNRMLSRISFNEIVICGILYRNAAGEKNPFTATELSAKMHMLKSQMNKLLTDLENNGYVCRRRSDEDKRKVYIELQEKGKTLYETEHGEVLRIVSRVTDALGEKQAVQLTGMMKEALRVVNEP